jgi:hypothetical protein
VDGGGGDYLTKQRIQRIHMTNETVESANKVGCCSEKRGSVHNRHGYELDADVPTSAKKAVGRMVRRDQRSQTLARSASGPRTQVP